MLKPKYICLFPQKVSFFTVTLPNNAVTHQNTGNKYYSKFGNAPSWNISMKSN